MDNIVLLYNILFTELVFMSEWWSGTKLSIYVKKDEYDKYYGREHGYLIMNHSYEIDWLMGWHFCDGIQVLGVSMRNGKTVIVVSFKTFNIKIFFCKLQK